MQVLGREYVAAVTTPYTLGDLVGTRVRVRVRARVRTNL